MTGLEGNFLGAIAFRDDGILYGIDMADAGGGPSKLYTIDTASGAASLVGPLGFDSVEGMTRNTSGFNSLMALAYSMEENQFAQLIRDRSYDRRGHFQPVHAAAIA